MIDLRRFAEIRRLVVVDRWPFVVVARRLELPTAAVRDAARAPRERGRSR
jgi:hypothetical protein